MDKEIKEVYRAYQQIKNENRLNFAYAKLLQYGFNVTIIGKKELQFEYDGSLIKFFPFTGWATGKTIKDGRGFKNLLSQILKDKQND